MFYSVTTLAQSLDIHPETIRRHIKLQYLKAQTVAGAKGYRIKGTDAKGWADLYLNKTLTQP